MTNRQPVTVTRIDVGVDRITIDVRISGLNWAFTTKALASRVQEEYPCIREHACVNDVGPMFGSVIDRTSVVHLLEHMIIEGQVRRASAQNATQVLAGRSYWTRQWTKRTAPKTPAEGRITFAEGRIEVRYFNDLDALASVNEAVDFLNKILTEE